MKEDLAELEKLGSSQKLRVESAVRDRAAALRLGEIRPTGGVERRLQEAARLGFRRVYGSTRSTLQVPGVSLVGFDHVEQLVRALAA